MTTLLNIFLYFKIFLVFLPFRSNLSLFPETELNEKNLTISVTVTMTHFSFGKYPPHCEYSADINDTVAPPHRSAEYYGVDSAKMVCRELYILRGTNL